MPTPPLDRAPHHLPSSALTEKTMIAICFLFMLVCFLLQKQRDIYLNMKCNTSPPEGVPLSRETWSQLLSCQPSLAIYLYIYIYICIHISLSLNLSLSLYISISISISISLSLYVYLALPASLSLARAFPLSPP